MPHHHSKDPPNTPPTIAAAAAGSRPAGGARAVKMAANMMMVGGLVSVSSTAPANAHGQDAAIVAALEPASAGGPSPGARSVVSPSQTSASPAAMSSPRRWPSRNDDTPASPSAATAA